MIASALTAGYLQPGLLLAGLLWPLLLALMLAFRRLRPLALPLAPWAGLPALLASLAVEPGETRWQLVGVLISSRIGLDSGGQLLLLLTALLWTLAGVYARAYFPQPQQRQRFYLFFLLAMSGNIGLILAQDLMAFYLGFGLMSFASYGLVVFNGDAEALRAGRVYIILVVASEVMLFAALLMATQSSLGNSFEAVRRGLVSADHRDLVMLLGVAGFGIKAGLLGLHVWLPLAHPVAPTPASAVLSGAMIKAGLLGWLLLLPAGEVAMPGWGTALLLLGLGGAFYGVAIGLTQRQPKTLLAYSSISQMGSITAALGLGLLLPASWPLILPVILFYALHHGLSKTALFLGVGLADHDYRLRGWIWLGMWLPALALAGAPWTSGMLAKLMLKTQALQAPAPWDALLPALLSISAVASALLMARLLYLLRPSDRPSAAPAAGLLWPWLASLLAVLLLPWWLLFEWLAAPTAVTSSLNTSQVFNSLWPLLLAALIFAAVVRGGWLRRIAPVPAGDLLVWLHHGLARLGDPSRLLNTTAAVARRLKSTLSSDLQGLQRTATARLQRIEQQLSHWPLAGLLLVLLVLTAASW